MKTSEVKFGKEYILDTTGEIVTIVTRISGRMTKKPNMQSGIIFTGYKREQKKFELSNGMIVKANRLKLKE